MLLVILVGFRFVDLESALAIFLATQFFGMALTMLGALMAVKRLTIYQRAIDVRRLIMFAVLLNWGYRQLTLVWRIRSLLPGETAWGEMPRAGFKQVEAA